MVALVVPWGATESGSRLKVRLPCGAVLHSPPVLRSALGMPAPATSCEPAGTSASVAPSAGLHGPAPPAAMAGGLGAASAGLAASPRPAFGAAQGAGAPLASEMVTLPT